MSTPIMIGARSASATPSMLYARTAQTVIKAMPIASRVVATSIAKRLNCRSRSSLVLNMADRRDLGRTHKSRLVGSGWSVSALPPRSDILSVCFNVRCVPTADIRSERGAKRDGCETRRRQHAL